MWWVVCIGRGGAGGDGGVRAAAGMRSQVHEKREVGGQKTEEDRWMYSAVIHKVESTTKLIATV